MRTTVWITVLLLGLCGCSETIDIDNVEAQITSVGALDMVTESGVPRYVDVAYSVRDLEGDDVDIVVEVCDADGSSCGVAWQGPGGDGTFRVITEPYDTNVSHVFRWDVACGVVIADARADADLSASSMFRIRIHGAETHLDSMPFALSDFGFSALPACVEEGE
jgi:hypothetical protein